MVLIFNQWLIHSGGKSRVDENQLTKDDLRLFSYLWTSDDYKYDTRNKNTSARSDSTKLHHMAANMCSGFNTNKNLCTKCTQEIEHTLDLSDIDTSLHLNGHIIAGDLRNLGWIVVKSDLINSYVEFELVQISYGTNKWSNIGNEKNRLMKYSSLDTPSKNWNSARLTMFFDGVKMLLDPLLPTYNYITARPNLLRNGGLIDSDQRAHADFDKKINLK